MVFVRFDGQGANLRAGIPWGYVPGMCPTNPQKFWRDAPVWLTNVVWVLSSHCLRWRHPTCVRMFYSIVELIFIW